MPSTLPIADPAPSDGALPASVGAGAAERDFGVYLHVPFCRVRCGYCDFNTYTSDELRGAKRSDYADQAAAEVAFAARVLAAADLPVRPVATVFFGGGTPTLLPASDLARMLAAVRDAWGLAEGAEITTEANPDSVDADYLQALRTAGFTRVSFGCSRPFRTCSRRWSARTIPRASRWSSSGQGRRGSRSASTSSTARRGRVSTTGAPRSSR